MRYTGHEIRKQAPGEKGDGEEGKEDSLKTTNSDAKEPNEISYFVKQIKKKKERRREKRGRKGGDQREERRMDLAF